MQLADRSWWEENFPGAKGGVDKRGATNFIFRTANRKGIFSLNKIRGRGAWIDQGRNVFHHGRELTVDGERVDVTRITGLYLYEYAAPHCVPADPAMTDDEGFKLLELAGKFRWTMPGSVADTERVSILTLLPKLTNGRAGEQWEALREEIHSLVVREPDIAGRLFRRTLDQLPTLLANIEIFKAAAARLFKSQRSGDQYGTLLAGCFALFSSKLATPEDAEWVIKNYVWTEHVESDTSDESARAFECLMARPIRCGKYELTVIEVMNVARGRRPPEGVEITAVEANACLQRYGIRVDESGRFLMIAPGIQQFLALMADTAYSADPRGVLKRSPWIDNNDNMAVKINSVSKKVLRCDLLKLLGESTTESTGGPPETPF